jgi:hypothetical protein
LGEEEPLPRNLWLAALSLASFSSIARAAEPAPPPLGDRKVTLLGGAGLATGGGLGVQAEMYFKGDRFSAFAGVGSPSELKGEETVSASGAGVTGGLRVYAGGRVHRGFLEAAVGPVGLEWGDGDWRPMYGPAFQAGWQMTRPGGFTLVLSGGVGHALETDFADGFTDAVVSFGLGYTWRRK